LEAKQIEKQKHSVIITLQDDLGYLPVPSAFDSIEPALIAIVGQSKIQEKSFLTSNESSSSLFLTFRRIVDLIMHFWR
jgi:hypothetical protein